VLPLELAQLGKRRRRVPGVDGLAALRSGPKSSRIKPRRFPVLIYPMAVFCT
jgi:hypothetical protein